MTPKQAYRRPENGADCWIVIRRRGGWNANPEVVGFHDTSGAAIWASCAPEMWDYDPPADATDVFTCHAVSPSLIATQPCEVRS